MSAHQIVAIYLREVSLCVLYDEKQLALMKFMSLKIVTNRPFDMQLSLTIYSYLA